MKVLFIHTRVLKLFASQVIFNIQLSILKYSNPKKIEKCFQDCVIWYRYRLDDVYIKIPDFRLSIYFGVAILID
jgi:hypothetical protein